MCYAMLHVDSFVARFCSCPIIFKNKILVTIKLIDKNLNLKRSSLDFPPKSLCIDTTNVSIFFKLILAFAIYNSDDSRLTPGIDGSAEVNSIKMKSGPGPLTKIWRWLAGKMRG